MTEAFLFLAVAAIVLATPVAIFFGAVEIGLRFRRGEGR